MSTLVTGGSGFIGRHVADRLADRGDRVVSYDRGPASLELPPGTVRVRGELFDLRRLVAAIGAHEVDGIVHAAGMADPALSECAPTAAVAANADGTAQVLEAARLAGFAGRMVLLSSTAVYGDHEAPLDEGAPLRPRTPYAATKAFGDLMGDVYACSFGLDVVSLRLSEVYGPGRAPGHVQAILEAAADGRALRLDAGWAQHVQPIHVDDAARAVVAALGAPPPGRRVYDVTGGERVPLARVAALVRDRITDVDVRLGAGPLSGADQQGPVAIAAADRELGYRPRWGLARGIDDYFAWREAGLEAAAS